MSNDVLAQTGAITGLTNDRAPTGWYFIYVFGTEDGLEVKTGHTKQAAAVRRAQHENEAGNNRPMRTLAVVLGQLADETHLKRYFAQWRSRTRSKEWFFASSDEIRGYIRWLRTLPFVSCTDTPADLLRLTAVDSSQWLPDDERRKEPTQLRLGESDPWSDIELDNIAEGDFYTHARLIEGARATMGGIDLDPSSCSEANTVVGAARYYAYHENGLLREWAGRVWLNPPFGNWDEWAAKAVAEWNSGRVEQMCVLASSRVSTAKHFHTLVQAASAVLIPCGRYPFWGPKATSTPDEGHLIYYFGAGLDEFREAFRLIGAVFSR